MLEAVPIENIFELDDDPSGFDIIFEASEFGIPPGCNPPDEITLKLPSGEVIKFDCCGQVVGSCDRLLYWSYWNESNEAQAINLKILND